MHAMQRKNPGPCRGFDVCRETRSVLGDDRAGPVEAVDQRGRDGLVPAVGADAVANREVGDVEQLVGGLGVVEGGTILGLHEPAGRSDAEDVQVVLDTATDEPAAAVVTIEMDTDGNTSQVGEARAAEVGARVAAVDVGQDVRSDQPAETHASGPRVFQLLPAGDAKGRILDGGADAAELAVREYA